MPRWVRVYCFAFGVLALAAVLRSFWEDDDTVANFFSKFTYQTNLYIAVVLLGGALLAPALTASGPARWDTVRGAAVMYAVTTFLVYGFLINGFDNPFNTTRPWTHTVLHQLIPVVLVLDLAIRPIAHRLRWRTAPLWAVYPIAFTIYSLIRGAIVGWYPYDFLDPAEVGGYPGVAGFAIAIAIGFLAIGYLIVGVSRWHHGRIVTRPVVAPEGTEPAVPGS